MWCTWKDWGVANLKKIKIKKNLHIELDVTPEMCCK